MLYQLARLVAYLGSREALSTRWLPAARLCARRYRPAALPGPGCHRAAPAADPPGATCRYGVRVPGRACPALPLQPHLRAAHALRAPRAATGGRRGQAPAQVGVPAVSGAAGLRGLGALGVRSREEGVSEVIVGSGI